MRYLIAAALLTTGMPGLPSEAMARNKADPDKIICKKQQAPLGSRLGAKRVCGTEAEWKAREEEIAGEAKRNIDKVQMQRATACPPNC